MSDGIPQPKHGEAALHETDAHQRFQVTSHSGQHERELLEPSMNSMQSAFVNAASGAFSGAMMSLVVSPLDVARIRQQSAMPGEVRHSLRHSLQQSFSLGGFRYLFRGLVPTLCGLIPNNTITLATYQSLRETITQRLHQQKGVEGDMHGWIVNPLAAMGAGVINALSTQPAWVIRSRMIMRPDEYCGGMVDSFSRVVQNDGWKGLWRGTSLSLIGVLHVMIQLPLYEALKEKLEVDPRHPSMIKVIPAVIVSKVVASSILYPHEVVRAKLMLHSSAEWGQSGRSNMLGLVKSIIQEDGFKGLYRGMSTTVLRAVPAAIIMFTSYEWAKASMMGMMHRNPIPVERVRVNRAPKKPDT